MGITSLFANMAEWISKITSMFYQHWRSGHYNIEKKVQVQLDTDEVLYNYAVDETGIVSTESLLNPNAECKEQYLYEKRRA